MTRPAEQPKVDRAQMLFDMLKEWSPDVADYKIWEWVNELEENMR